MGNPACRRRLVYLHFFFFISNQYTEGSQIGVDNQSQETKPLQSKYPDLPADYYIPKDPWYIRARLLKEGVKPPGPSTSTNSSRSDLEEVRRRLHLTGITFSVDEKHPDKQPTSTGSSVSQQQSVPRISYGVWVFIDIQLYQLEQNSYMVDFKCDGYQNVIRPEGDTEWHPISKRFRNREKEVTSPYPFLDVASDLVAQLAVAA